MTMIGSKVPARRSPRFLDRLFDFSGALKIKADAQISALHSRLLVKKMLTMEDHMLDDMGINRRDVVEALKSPWRQNPSQLLARSRRCRIDANKWGRNF